MVASAVYLPLLTPTQLVSNLLVGAAADKFARENDLPKRKHTQLRNALLVEMSAPSMLEGFSHDPTSITEFLIKSGLAAAAAGKVAAALTNSGDG